jgi:hypothetical protein
MGGVQGKDCSTQICSEARILIFRFDGAGRHCAPGNFLIGASGRGPSIEPAQHFLEGFQIFAAENLPKKAMQSVRFLDLADGSSNP